MFYQGGILSAPWEMHILCKLPEIPDLDDAVISTRQEQRVHPVPRDHVHVPRVGVAGQHVGLARRGPAVPDSHGFVHRT